MKLLWLFGLLTVGIFSGTNNHEIKNASWLIGTWENKTTRGSMYEHWAAGGSQELLGKSFILRGSDTVIFETIRLVQEGELLIYIPTVKNQNQGLPVRFPSTSVNEDQLVFENPQHDFPQKITYTRVGKDSLVAEISGIRNGKAGKQTFPMKRVQ